MGIPRLAKHAAAIASAAAGSISRAMLEADIINGTKIEDAAVSAEHLNPADDFTVGTLEAAGLIKGLPIQTKDAHHTGVALADLTAAFGAPAGLPNGSIYTYKNDTDSKIYLVVVVGSVFHIEEVTPVTA